MPVLHRQRACNRVSPAPTVSKLVQEASVLPPQQDVLRVEQEQPTCRLCWDTADSTEPGGELLSPCACSGSLRYIHKRCLQDWQRTLRSQGQGRRANTCELVGACLPACLQALCLQPSWQLLLVRSRVRRAAATLAELMLLHRVTRSRPCSCCISISTNTVLRKVWSAHDTNMSTCQALLQAQQACMRTAVATALYVAHHLPCMLWVPSAAVQVTVPAAGWLWQQRRAAVAAAANADQPQRSTV
ncbi:hypothetical protein COO60DRAFT_139991 [Scenedesmus sp. NREL 46B-D3]|nr:hypothetical protein COO60DRAFT_139991 [Scenedesmus sp. NREL 46B-D3]